MNRSPDRYTDRGNHVIKQGWPEARFNKSTRSMGQQEFGCDDNILNQPTREALDRYTDTCKHVRRKELAEGQL